MPPRWATVGQWTNAEASCTFLNVRVHSALQTCGVPFARMQDCVQQLGVMGEGSSLGARALRDTLGSAD